MANTIEKVQTTTLAPERTRGGRCYLPTVDILENGEKYLVIADVPGATADSIDVSYERGLLTIHARVAERKPAEHATCLLREYGVGDFYRSFQIGEGIDANRIQADVADGVLTLHLPKSEAARTRKITVRPAQ